MTLYPEQLDTYLQKQGLPAVLRIFGDEPLLQDDCLQIVRRFAKQQGFDDRQSWQQQNDFDWQQLNLSQQSMSLFAERRLIELCLPEAKPGKTGADALKQYAAQVPEDTCLVLYGPKLKREQQQAKWFKVFDAHGPLLLTLSPDRSRLPRFINQRAQRYQLRLAADAVEHLADWYEGNLLALDQELAKLSLLGINSPIELSQIQQQLQDNSRFSVFAIQESLLQGHFEQACHRLQRVLEADGEAAIVAWLLTREWQLLSQVKQAQALQQDPQACFKGTMVWKNQQPLYLQWAERLTMATLVQLGDLLTRVELALKRDSGEDWSTLVVHIMALLCQPTAVSESLQCYSEYRPASSL